MRVLLLASNTLKELIRDRTLLGLLIFGLVVIAVSEAFGMISAGEDVKFVIDISLGAMLLFAVLISVMGGTGLVYREMERKTIYTIVSRPVRRWEFVVGKYVGLLVLLAVNVAAMGLLFLGYLSLMGGSIGLTLFQAILMTFLEVMVVTAVALLLSTLTSPMLGAIITFTLFLVGHGTGELKLLSEGASNQFLRLLFGGAYYVLPNLENFNIRAEAAHYVTVEWTRVGIAGLWAAAYSTLAVLMAIVVFERRNF